MTISEAICQRIIDLMQENDLNTSELARRASLRQSTLNSILKGEVKSPTVQSIYLVSRAVGISLDQFFSSHYFKDIDLESFNKKNR